MIHIPRYLDNLRWFVFLRSLTEPQVADFSALLVALETKKPHADEPGLSFLESVSPEQLTEFRTLVAGPQSWSRVH